MKSLIRNLLIPILACLPVIALGFQSQYVTIPAVDQIRYMRTIEPVVERYVEGKEKSELMDMRNKIVNIINTCNPTDRRFWILEYIVYLIDKELECDCF